MLLDFIVFFIKTGQLWEIAHVDETAIILPYQEKLPARHSC